VHELVHAILDANIGAPASFFDEGAAVALGGPDWEGEPAPDYSQPLDPLLGAPSLPFSAFTLAGDLASYLLSTKGSAPYVDLLRRAPYGSSATAVRAAFLAAFGQTIDDVVAERQASGKQFAAARLSFPECSLAPINWSAATWVSTIPVDCTSTGVGPLYATDPPLAHAFATLDIPAGGYYHATLTANGGFAAMHRCSDGNQVASLSYEHTPSGPGRHELLAAFGAVRHFFTFQTYTTSSQMLTLTIQPTTEAGAACPAPPPLDIANDTNDVELLGGDAEIVASLRSPTDQRWTTEVWPSAHLWQCANPCTASSCTELASQASVTFLAGTIYTFRASGPKAGFYR
jgi:hypothetical protein